MLNHKFFHLALNTKKIIILMKSYIENEIESLEKLTLSGKLTQSIFTQNSIK